jgi:hypothetical protein
MKPQGSNLNKPGSKYSPGPVQYNEVLFKMGATDLATTCSIHYGLNTEMVIHYLKGEYARESKDADAILTTDPPTSMMEIASISSESSTRAARRTSILKKSMRIST